jgi:hypothetical protein
MDLDALLKTAGVCLDHTEDDLAEDSRALRGA